MQSGQRQNEPRVWMRDVLLVGIVLISALIRFLNYRWSELELNTVWYYTLGAAFIAHTLLREKSLACPLLQTLMCLFSAAVLSGGFYLRYRETGMVVGWARLALAAVLFVYFTLLLLSLCVTRLFSPCAPEMRRRPCMGEYVLLALFLAAVLALLYLPRYPYLATPDTINQWQQVHGLIRYNKIHAIGHTIYLKLLLSIWDSYVFVVLVQLLGLLLLYLLIAVFFSTRGLSLRRIAFVEGLSLLLTANGTEALFAPWKDLPAALCLGLLSFFFLYLPEKKRLRTAEAFLLGLMLAWTALLRLNGAVTTLVCGLCFAVMLARGAQYRQLCAVLLAAVLSVLGVRVYENTVLKPVNIPNGFAIQVFGSGIATVVREDTLSPEEEERIGALLSLDWMREHKNPYLIWESDGDPEIFEDANLGQMNNRFVLDMGGNKKEVVLLYASLLPRHLPTLMKDVVRNTCLVWEVFGESYPSSHAFLFAVLLIMVLRFRLKARELLVFLPCACNTLSIMISTITNEIRYVVPTLLLFPLFLLCFMRKAGEGESRRR